MPSFYKCSWRLKEVEKNIISLRKGLDSFCPLEACHSLLLYVFLFILRLLSHFLQWLAWQQQIMPTPGIMAMATCQASPILVGLLSRLAFFGSSCTGTGTGSVLIPSACVCPSAFFFPCPCIQCLMWQPSCCGLCTWWWLPHDSSMYKAWQLASLFGCPSIVSRLAKPSTGLPTSQGNVSKAACLCWHFGFSLCSSLLDRWRMEEELGLVKAEERQHFGAALR